MKYSPSNDREYTINTVFIDLNGTLSVFGEIVSGVKERFAKLKNLGVEVILLTGDQRGTAADLCQNLDIDYKIAKTAEEKAMIVSKYDKETTASIGNGRIDIGMFKYSVVSIATLQAEGIHVEILQHVDVLVPSINDALDFLLEKNVFDGTMRK